MALLHLDFESQFLGANTDVNIIVPDKPREISPAQFYQSGKKYRVLWLLHGTFGGYSDWVRKSNIELYACEHDIIVVMPGVGNSDYEAWNNFTLGYDSEKYIVEELMPLVYGWLPASNKREDNFIAGLSMGGGGALKFALHYPQLFAKCASLSYCPRDPALMKDNLKALFDMDRSEVEKDEGDVMHMKLRYYNIMHRWDTFEDYEKNHYDIYNELIHAKDRKDLPAFLFTVGDKDPLMTESFHALKKKLDEIGFAAKWSEDPVSHEWRVWERDIQKAFVFFGFSDEMKGNAF